MLSLRAGGCLSAAAFMVSIALSSDQEREHGSAIPL